MELKKILHNIFLSVGRFNAKTESCCKKTAHFITEELSYLFKGIEYLKEAVKTHPESALAHYNLAEALLRKARFNEAALYFERAALLDFYYIDAYLGTAHAYRELDKHDNSLNALKRAMRYNKESPDIYYELGLTYEKDTMSDEAAASFKKAIELRPDFKAARSALERAQKSRSSTL